MGLWLWLIALAAFSMFSLDRQFGFVRLKRKKKR